MNLVKGKNNLLPEKRLKTRGKKGRHWDNLLPTGNFSPQRDVMDGKLSLKQKISFSPCITQSLVLFGTRKSSDFLQALSKILLCLYHHFIA